MIRTVLGIVAMVALSACVAPEKSSYQRMVESTPVPLAGIGSERRGRDYHMWKNRQRCKVVYSYSCLEMDIHGERRP